MKDKEEAFLSELKSANELHTRQEETIKSLKQLEENLSAQLAEKDKELAQIVAVMSLNKQLQTSLQAA